MQELIREFMQQKRFAVIGTSNNTEKYGYKIFMNLKSRGYEVCPVNPSLEEVAGSKCYHHLSDIPFKVDVVDFVVPPPVTEAVLRECKELGLKRIWLQPGSQSQAAIDYCHQNNLMVVHDACVMMN